MYQTNPGQGSPENQQNGFLKNAEDELYKLYQKVPYHLPPSAREFIVHYGPWITLVLMIIALPALLLALGITAVFSPFGAMYGAHRGGLFFVSGLISLGAFALELIALPGLFKRQMSSWKMVFYSVLLSALSSLLAMNWFGLIIGTAISCYILFEIKTYYK